MDQPRLQTVSEVFEALGGVTAVATLTGSSLQAVCNWRGTGRIAPANFLVMCRALKRRGLSANPSLWSIKEPESAE